MKEFLIPLNYSNLEQLASEKGIFNFFTKDSLIIINLNKMTISEYDVIFQNNIKKFLISSVIINKNNDFIIEISDFEKNVENHNYISYFLNDIL